MSCNVLFLKKLSDPEQIVNDYGCVSARFRALFLCNCLSTRVFEVKELWKKASTSSHTHTHQVTASPSRDNIRSDEKVEREKICNLNHVLGISLVFFSLAASLIAIFILLQLFLHSVLLPSCSFSKGFSSTILATTSGQTSGEEKSFTAAASGTLPQLQVKTKN